MRVSQMVMMMRWLLCFSAYSKSMSHTIFHNVPTTTNKKKWKKGFINHFLRLLILAKFPADFWISAFMFCNVFNKTENFWGIFGANFFFRLHSFKNRLFYMSHFLFQITYCVTKHTILKVKFLSKNSIFTKPDPNIFTSFSPNFFDNFSREIKMVNS